MIVCTPQLIDYVAFNVHTNCCLDFKLRRTEFEAIADLCLDLSCSRRPFEATDLLFYKLTDLKSDKQTGGRIDSSESAD